MEGKKVNQALLSDRASNPLKPYKSHYIEMYARLNKIEARKNDSAIGPTRKGNPKRNENIFLEMIYLMEEVDLIQDG